MGGSAGDVGKATRRKCWRMRLPQLNRRKGLCSFEVWSAEATEGTLVILQTMLRVPSPTSQALHLASRPWKCALEKMCVCVCVCLSACLSVCVRPWPNIAPKSIDQSLSYSISGVLLYISQADFFSFLSTCKFKGSSLVGKIKNVYFLKKWLQRF